MNGVTPKFMEGLQLTPGYFDEPDPYKAPPKSRVSLRKLSAYSDKLGKKIAELTKEEFECFLTKQT